MAENEKQRAFLTTVPGILTGLASLITACVGAATVWNQTANSRKAPEPAAVSAAASDSAVHASLADAPGAKCQAIAGEWDWFTGGVVRFLASGALEWRQVPGSAAPTATGRWGCDPSSGRYTLAWMNGFIDIIGLSQDGRSVSGSNQQNGVLVTGTRR